MCVVKQGDKSFYFIHIPRTAGRYVKSMFGNSPNVELEFIRNEQRTFKNVYVMHLHYPLYLDYFSIKDIPHITVVRNPYDKFLSTIRCMHFLDGCDYKSYMGNEKMFLEFISEQISYSSAHNNWFLPQHKFISPKTYFWKYENGFGKNFVDWIFNITKIRINLPISKCEYEYIGNEKEMMGMHYELHEGVKEYVKNFYNIDYIKFGYDS